MTRPENEKLFNYLVTKEVPGRHFSSAEDNRWGGLVTPGPHENPDKSDEGLRVVVFASWKFGFILFETLKKYERIYPQKLNLVGLVTDDPLNPDAKISKMKRIWHILEQPYQVIDETYLVESALTHGMQAYTGEIKIESFHRLLRQWNPDAIVVCVFGQIIDSFIIKYPPYGIYNFHPSDLSHHEGAGPAPYDDLVTHNADTTVWTIHHISEEIDSGHIVGQSPPIFVRDKNGILPGDPLVVYDKIAEMLSPLTKSFIEELCARFERKQSGLSEHIDFSARIPEEVKKKNLLPIIHDKPNEMLPDPDDLIFSD